MAPEGMSPMPARGELSTANQAHFILDRTHTPSPVRPEEGFYDIPTQQSLDLGAPRAGKSPANTSHTPTRRARVAKPSRVADKRQKMSCAREDGTPVADTLPRDSSREALPPALSSATSVGHIPVSALQNSTNVMGSGTALPSRAFGHAEVPLAERVALSVEEAGALLGISRDLAYDLVARGELPSIRLGRRLVVPRRALEEALNRSSDAG